MAYILKEDGYKLLKEDGYAILLETFVHYGSATLSGIGTLATACRRIALTLQLYGRAWTAQLYGRALTLQLWGRALVAKL